MRGPKFNTVMRSCYLALTQNHGNNLNISQFLPSHFGRNFNNGHLVNKLSTDDNIADVNIMDKEGVTKNGRKTVRQDEYSAMWSIIDH